MTIAKSSPRSGIACRDCPLRVLPLFEPFTEDTLRFMENFKVGELSVGPGTTLLMEGSNAPQLYTALEGMGVRYKILENGNRQIVNFILPGDFLGLQAGVMGEMKHSAEAVSKMTLCVFERSALWRLFADEPARAFDITWLAAMEEHFLGESLASIGQREGRARVAWALTRVFLRLRALKLGMSRAVPFPFRQQDLADTIGMSLVHTNKTLQRLRQDGLLDWKEGVLSVPDIAALAEVAGIDLEKPEVRPLM